MSDASLPKVSQPCGHAPEPAACDGFTMVELMIALAIGSFVIVGALTLFGQSRATYRSVAAVANLHENARFAFDRLEADLRMAGYWGMTARAHRIRNRAGARAPVPPELAVGNDCGTEWALRLDLAVEAANDGYSWACAPFAGEASAGADTLAVRRAAATPERTPAAGVMHVRLPPAGEGWLFVAPEETHDEVGRPTSPTHRLVVHGYYVSPTSSLSTASHRVPSLRVKTLRGGALGPRMLDEEVLPGIEDMQIELGVDTAAPGSPGRGLVDRYVNPDDPLLQPSQGAGARVLAVRVWLRVRAEHPEPGYLDTTDYAYADRRQPPPLDRFRRLLVSRTIYLRNVAGAP